MEHITPKSQIVYYGGSRNAIQNNLDFDHASQKTEPSLKAIVKPGKSGVEQYFWGDKEILIPVLPTVTDAVTQFPDIVAAANMASKRSAYDAALEIMGHPTIRYQAIIAEGIPERDVRILRIKAKEYEHTILGPSIFGIIIAGVLQLGPAGGTVFNQTKAGLHTTGSVGVVTRSGGLVNEFAHIVHQATESVHSIISIGGDRYPCSRLIDIIKEFEKDEIVKLIVMQGEVGGSQENEVINAVKNGAITKPIVGWCIGTSADYLPKEFQFGHAGAQANTENDSAIEKNNQLAEAGIFVPTSFEQLTSCISKIATSFSVTPKQTHEIITTLYTDRKPSSIVSTTTPTINGEIHYFNTPANKFAKDPDKTIGHLIGLLWFERELPDFAVEYFNLILKLVADHGPNVSGAHNTIIAARAGKDLVSSLSSGLLTIGSRFGGASNQAAKNWLTYSTRSISPHDFVAEMKLFHQNIPGIGHRIKSRFNPDPRVSSIEEYVKTISADSTYVTYARAVEEITLQKNHKLILNVDGAIGAATLDILQAAGFTNKELGEIIEQEVIDALFVLGRSIGLIGHHIDQKRLRSPLYRHNPQDTFNPHE